MVSPYVKTRFTPSGDITFSYKQRNSKGQLLGSATATMSRKDFVRLFQDLQRGNKTQKQVAGIVKFVGKVKIEDQRKNAMDGINQVLNDYFHPTQKQRAQLNQMMEGMSMSDFREWYDSNSHLVGRVWGYTDASGNEVYDSSEKEDILNQVIGTMAKATGTDAHSLRNAHIDDVKYTWRYTSKSGGK